MLLLSLDNFRHRYVVNLAPDAVSLVKLRKGLKRKVPEQQQIALNPELMNPAWSAAVAALEQLLMKSGVGLPVTIVLANQWVRYQVIPAMPPLTAISKRQAVAQHCFRAAYGDVVDDWAISMSPIPDGDSLLVSAVDASLISAVQALAKQYGCKLQSIQPALMYGFNALRQQVRATTFCYAHIEACGRITLALSHGGAWHSLSACVADQDWSSQLAALISRETLLAGWQQRQITIYLHTPNTVHARKIASAFTAEQHWPTVHLMNPDAHVPALIGSQSMPLTMSVLD